MASKGVSILKFVGTVSLGLLTGVSYTVSTLTLPTLLLLPSSSSAAQALSSLTSSLRLSILTLSSLAAAPLLLSFIFSPRPFRHPYLVYTSLLVVLSATAPDLLLPPSQPAAPRAAASISKPRPSPRAGMEASYEVLGDSHSEGDLASEDDVEDVNGEEVRVCVEAAAKAYVVRAAVAAVAFAMSVVGLWGDGAPRAVVSVA